jgi:hypothetical protein
MLRSSVPGLLSGSVSDAINTPLLAPSVQRLEIGDGERRCGGRCAAVVRENAAYACIGVAYATFMYMMTSKLRYESNGKWGDYHWSWSVIGLCGLGWVIATAVQCKNGACQLGTGDGSRRVKWSRISGWVWCVLIMVVILSLPTVLYFFGSVQRCAVDVSWVASDCQKEKLECQKENCEAVSGCKFTEAQGCQNMDSGHAAQHAEPQAYGKILSSVFAVLAVILGMREMAGHWRNYHEPLLQKQVVRILAIVPIYAICSFLTLMACADRKPLPPRCYHEGGPETGSGSGWAADDPAALNRSGAAGGRGLVPHSLEPEPNCFDGPVGVANLALSLVRELYEAYTLYSFFTFLTLALAKQANEREELQRAYRASRQEEDEVLQAQGIDAASQRKVHELLKGIGACWATERSLPPPPPCSCFCPACARLYGGDGAVVGLWRGV